ncbi:MAG: 7-cyano-7-deazaguanine synthase QueC [Clostridia bacterium]|jgi:7-cyano-7-deazaguanine synthase|nr:7-cyano-7-deazaguanine synthase QueC [Clostridia bacterium]MDH7573917.1 7-cyano-7-deazaguanine synthase QueC [Clostridia bacterium]
MAGKVVVVLSGGLDSTTCMAIARAAGEDIYPVTFTYGQKHEVELEAARRVAEFYGVGRRHRLVDLRGLFSGSSLTDPDKEVPTNRSAEEMARDIPSTYVPARNTVFLALALAVAEPLGAEAIYIGVNAVDFSGYPDCRPEFIRAFQEVINQGTAAGTRGEGIQIRAPLLRLSKAEIIRRGIALGAPYHLTYSCYMGTVPSCGVCDACRLRQKGFRDAGVADPIPYRSPAPGRESCGYRGGEP